MSLGFTGLRFRNCVHLLQKEALLLTIYPEYGKLV